MSRIIEYFAKNRGHARKMLRAACLLWTGAALTACSIHPVQQDVTGVPPKVIVERIRCEARLSIIDKAIDMLRQAANHYRDSKPAADTKFDTLSLKLESQRQLGGPIVFDPRDLPTAEARAFYGRYINTAIAYDFLMQGVETNKAGFIADPVRLITNGAAGVTFGASSELVRDNQRHYAFADTFRELLLDSRKCTPDYLPPNFLYPVSGSVGLREVVGTFIDLNEGKSLTPLDTDKTIFADTLKFTTTLTGSVTPHVQFDPIGTQFGLAPTNVGLSAIRSDVHTLTVGLAMGPPQFVPITDIPLPLAIRPRFTRDTRVQESNKDAALLAIRELRIRSFLDRAGTLIVR